MLTKKDVVIPTVMSLGLVGLLYLSVSAQSKPVYNFPQAAQTPELSCFKWNFNNKAHNEIVDVANKTNDLQSPNVNGFGSVSLNVSSNKNTEDYGAAAIPIDGVRVIDPYLDNSTDDLQVNSGKVLILGQRNPNEVETPYKDNYLGGDFVFDTTGGTYTKVKFTTIDVGDEVDANDRINHHYLEVTDVRGTKKIEQIFESGSGNLPNSYVWTHESENYPTGIQKLRIHISGSGALDNLEICGPSVTNTPTPIPTATNTPTPQVTNTPTPTPTNTPTPPQVSRIWEEFSDAKWSETNQTGWLDQWRYHTVSSNPSVYSDHGTPKLLRTFEVDRRKTVEIDLRQLQANDNKATANNCNPQFNEDAWFGVYRLNAQGQGTSLVKGCQFVSANSIGSGDVVRCFGDGNYDTQGNEKVSREMILTLNPGSYGLSVIWAGDGRTGPTYTGVSSARSYINPETNESIKYPQTIESTLYSEKACRWNGSYAIRARLCI